MASKTKVKTKNAEAKQSIVVETLYPEEHKKSDVDFIGNELVKLTNRVNELELSLGTIQSKLKTVSGRLGL